MKYSEVRFKTTGETVGSNYSLLLHPKCKSIELFISNAGWELMDHRTRSRPAHFEQEMFVFAYSSY